MYKQLVVVQILVSLLSAISSSSSSSSSSFTSPLLTPSDNIQQIIEDAINQTATNGAPIRSINIQLDSGLFQSRGNCPIVIRNLAPFTSIAIVGKGSSRTILDCSSFSSRCLEISNSAQITISELQFRNGVAPNINSAAAAPSNTTLNDDHVQILQQRSNGHRTSRRNLPIRVDTKRSWVVVSFQVHYSLSFSGKVSKKVVLTTPLSYSRHTPNDKKMKTTHIKLNQAASYTADAAGGNILVSSCSSVNMNNLIVTRGRATLFGGGIAVYNSFNVNLNGCAVHENRLNPIPSFPIPDYFGGAGVWINNSTAVSIRNSSLHDNRISVANLNLGGQHVNIGGGGVGIVASSRCGLEATQLLRNSIEFGDNVGGIAKLLGGGLYCFQCIDTFVTGLVSVLSNTVVLSNGAGNLYGAGIDLHLCANTSLIGPMVVANNTLLSLVLDHDNYMYSGGIFVESCTRTSLIGPMSVSLNTLLSTGPGSGDLLGGIGIAYCTNTSLIGPISVTENVAETYGNGGMYGGGLYIFGCAYISLLGPITIANNKLQATADTGLAGGGIHIDSCVNLSLIGPISMTHNALFLVANAYIYGGGLYISSCLNTSLVGPLVASGNVLQLWGDGYAYGGGVYIYRSDYTTFVGPILVDNNTVQSTGDSYLNAGGIQLQYCSYSSITGPVAVSNNILISRGLAILFGAGLNLDGCANLILSGPVSLTANTQQSNGNSAMYGGGLYVLGCNMLSLVGPISISSNKMQSTGFGSLFGGGMYTEGSASISLAGPFDVFNNSLLSSWKFSDQSDDDSGFYRKTSATDPQCGAVTISNSAGSIEDGSFDQEYAPNLHCTWLISPLPTLQAFSVLQFNVSMLDVRSHDFVYFYDGPTSLSPLIGKYSGTLSSWKCNSNTPCQSINSPIISSAGAVLIVFTTDAHLEFQGFHIDWVTIPINRTAGSTSQILIDYNYYPIIVSGSGLYTTDSNILIQNASIRSNTVQSPFLSVGSGLAMNAISSAASARLIDVAFIGNRALGTNAVGGAVAVVSSLSSFSCERCFFDKNMAVAKGGYSCYFASETTLCPSAFGGSLFQGYNSVVNMSRSAIQSSAVICDSPIVPCSTGGGGMGVFNARSQLSMTCESSAATCSNASVCTSTFGGCLHVADSSVNVIHSEFVSNTALLGVGSGGAISITGSSIVNISSSQFQSNFADHGGCISMADSSSTAMDNSVFVKNAASSIGGVISIRDDSNMVLDKIYFEDNEASRASAIVSYNDNGVAKYTMSNSFGVVVVGSSFLMLGNSIFDRNNTWNCSQPGSVFTQDKTSSLFSLTCVACDEGTYAVDSASTLFVDRKCASCPFGARCSGSKDVSNGLYALTDYWGLAINGSVKFYQCPSGYCCGFNQENCTYNYCAGNRIGLLCGQCADGYGMRFFAEGCKSDIDCRDAKWFAWIIILCAMVGAIMLLVTTTRRGSGMLSVLLYFYQVLPLVKSTSWKYTYPVLIFSLQSVFNFSPSGSSDSAGICLIQSMTPVQKIGARMLIQGLVLVALVLLYLNHAILYWSKIISRWQWATKHPHISHYIATAIRLCTIAYTTLVLVPLQMIQCVNIDNKSVWWWDASIECYTTSWQKAGFAAIAVLSPLPLCIMILLIKKWKSEDELKQKWQKQIWKVLSSGYKAERRWWLGVSLYRRLVMVVIYSTITDGNWKAMAASGACVLFLVINFAFEPFRTPTTNKSETISLTILTLLSITTSPQLSMIQFGTLEPTHFEAALEWLQFGLAVLPALGYVLLCTYRLIPSLKSSDSEESELHQMEDEWVGRDNSSLEEWVGRDNSSLEECDLCQKIGNCQQHQYC